MMKTKELEWKAFMNGEIVEKKSDSAFNKIPAVATNSFYGK